MQLKDAIRERKSVTWYHHKKPDWRKVVRAIDAVRYAPNADGQAVLKFVMVSDEKKIAELKDACQQDFVGKAKIVVVVTSDDSKMVRSYKGRGERYSSLQAGAAIQNFLLELTEQKLVTKWVRYFVDEQVKRILDIPEKMEVEGVFPIGVPVKARTREERKASLDSIIYFDKWKNKKMTPHTRVRMESI